MTANKMALDALTAIVEADDAQCLGQSHIEQARAAIAALRAMDAEARKRGEMYPQTRDEQEADTKAVRNVIESLEFYTSGRQVGANGWPGIKDWPALPVASTVAALKSRADALAARVAELEKDARRLDAVERNRFELTPLEGGGWDVSQYHSETCDSQLFAVGELTARAAIDSAALAAKGQA